MAPRTLGEDLRKRRGEQGLRKADIAAEIGVLVETYPVGCAPGAAVGAAVGGGTGAVAGAASTPR